MSETFYSVLGVDPEADTERIKEAYRALVKDHHPDVSDEDDAAETFKRITDARDVLVDEASRDRYDRVGHAAYVRRYLDSSAWNPDAAGAADVTDWVDETTDAADDGDAEDDGAASGYRTGRSAHAGARGSSTGSENAENYERYRANHSETGTSDWSAGGDSAWTDTDGFDSDWSEADAASEHAAAGTNADPRGRAATEQWRAAQAAANAYRPSGFEGTGGFDDDLASPSLVGALLDVGPWLLFHAVFLVSAFVTVWLIMSWVPSVPMLFLSLVLLGSTVFFSVLHMVSQLYS